MKPILGQTAVTPAGVGTIVGWERWQDGRLKHVTARIQVTGHAHHYDPDNVKLVPFNALEPCE